MKNLKTIMVAVIATAFMNTATFAQGNCVEKGTVIVDAFYGFPYINGTLLKAAYTDSVGNSNQVKNLNHFGGKVEIMVSDKIGVGLEGTYAMASVRYPSGGQIYTAGINKLRVLAKFNLHFATGESIDPYFTCGIGYKNTKVYDDYPNSATNITLNIVPIAFRAGIGMRYFFSDIVGVHAEVGLGGPIMQGGLSFKF